MTITSVTKERDSLVIVEDGVTKKRSIVYHDCVTSYPPTGYTEVGVIYVDEASSKLIIQYNDSTTEIELDATIDLTGAEIVALLEALAASSRLEITYLDDGSTYIRFTATERTKLGNIETGATADLTGAEIVALLEALTASSRLSHTKLDDVGVSDHHAKYTDAEAQAAIVRYFVCICFDWTTDVATGDGKFYFHIPLALNGMNLVYCHALVITAGTTNTLDIQVNNVTDSNGGEVDFLSTKLTVDSGETGSDTAATPYVIDTTKDDVATNDVIRIDVDAVHTTPAKGLIVTLGFQLP